MDTANIFDGGDRPINPGKATVEGKLIDPQPERSGHRLTRKGMEEVLDAGGSLFIPDPNYVRTPGLAADAYEAVPSIHVTRKDQLPSDAVLARGDVRLEADARAKLKAQIAQTTADLKSLDDAEANRKAEADKKAAEDESSRKAAEDEASKKKGR